MRGSLKCFGIVSGLMLAAAWLSASASAATIFAESFDGTNNGATTLSTLENAGWTFNNPDGWNNDHSTDLGPTGKLDVYSDGAFSDAYLRLGGNTESVPSAAKSFGAPVAHGSVYAVIGAASSYANGTLWVMSGTTELFRIIVNPTSVQVKGATSTTYDDTTGGSHNYSMNTLGGGGSYANRLNVTFSWHVASDGTGGVFNYVLNQSDSDHTGNLALSTGLVAGVAFKNSGVPDSIVFSAERHDNSSRLLALYQISAQSLPEPAALGLLMLVGFSGLIRRRT